MQKYYCLHYLSQDTQSTKNALRDCQALILIRHKWQGALAVPIPLLDPFLKLRTKLLVTRHPKDLRCKIIDHKNYFLCGTWSCSSNSIKSVVISSSFTENHMALTGRWSSKPSNKHQCASCHIAFISWYASFHGCTSNTSCWGKGHVHIGVCLFLQGFFDATVSAISPSAGPLSTDDQPSETPERFLRLLDPREPDEKRHDAGKCHICVTDWNIAARIHYSVSNRPSDTSLSWALLKRPAIHGFPAAGGEIYCRSAGVGEREVYSCVPTETHYITSNVSTFSFM